MSWIPRPETETIIEAALSILSGRRAEALRTLDLGIGSGALLCALLTEFGAARGVWRRPFSRRSRRGAGPTSGLRPVFGDAKFRLATGREGLDGPFDLIVSNPPYIPTADLPGLPREVRDFDPWLALDGGEWTGSPPSRQTSCRKRGVCLLPAAGCSQNWVRAKPTAQTVIANQLWFFRRRFSKDLAGLGPRPRRRPFPADFNADGQRSP